MKKFIDEPELYVDECIDGILCAHGNRLKPLGKDRRIIVAARKKAAKVAIVTGGGSGHLPVFLGYVGRGMLDGCAVGNVFASPPSSRILEMIKHCDSGAGVLCLYGNYGGDNLNFDAACEMADTYEIKTRTVRVNDDIASASKTEKSKRRGVAGMVYAFKIAGAAAMTGEDLSEVTRIAQETVDDTRTMGIALSSCIVPEVGKPTFQLQDDQMGIGMGIHGEPGISVEKMMTAKDAASVVMNQLLCDITLKPGDEVSLMVNGLGSTPLEELYIIFKHACRILKEQNIKIFMPHIGEFATSMEMAGMSITVLKLNDERKRYLRIPANTPFYTNGNK